MNKGGQKGGGRRWVKSAGGVRTTSDKVCGTEREKAPGTARKKDKSELTVMAKRL
jgi:hypothetical protein